jgi:hypothetical protein
VPLAWLISTIALLAMAALWWRHDRRRAALGCLAWFVVSVAAGYAFLGTVPSGSGVCGAGEPSPTIAVADPALVGDRCRDTARLYVAAASAVILASFAIVAASLWQRRRRPVTPVS